MSRSDPRLEDDVDQEEILADDVDRGDVVVWDPVMNPLLDALLGVVISPDRAGLRIDSPALPTPSAIRSGKILDVVDGAEILGVDGDGFYHLYYGGTHRITVRNATGDVVDHIEPNIFEDDVPDWVEFVRDRRSWQELATDRYTHPEADRP